MEAHVDRKLHKNPDVHFKKTLDRQSSRNIKPDVSKISSGVVFLRIDDAYGKIYRIYGKEFVFITNCCQYNPTTGVMDGIRCGKGFKVGPPSATDSYTTEQLIDLGMIGVYEELETHKEMMKKWKPESSL
jgi:putative component of toxin-antitoxin plasmid stabilization module